jgi:hypothetical protein
MASSILVGLSIFDKSGFYAVFSGGTLPQVDSELAVINSVGFAGKNAFEGALLMRKAGLRSSPFDKLHDFRKGAHELEDAIAQDSTNTEYRFLRLVIQENAPGIVKYRDDLEKDNLYIHQHFQELSPVVQKAVRDYSRHSRILRPDNL